MKESRGPIVEFISSKRKKLLALMTGAAIAGGIVEHETKPVAAQTVETIQAQPELTGHEAIVKALENLDEGRTIESEAQIDARFKEIDALINLAYYKNNTKPMVIQVDRYLGVVLSAPLTDADAKYKKMTPAEVGEEMRPIIEHGKMDETREEALRISKGRARQAVIEATLHMSPKQIERLGILLGLNVQSSHSDSSSRLGPTWKKKMETESSTSEEVREYVPSTIKQLKGKEGSVTLSGWIDKQQAAIDLVAAHADELGVSPNLIKLLTPEAILGVIHAETCSDLDAEAFVMLSPVLFETYNVAFLPAMDKNYSGGAVQITASTVKRLKEKHREALGRIQSTDPAAKFLSESKDSRSEMSASITDDEKQFFLNVLVLAENLRLAMRKINTDPRFLSAWNSASETDRSVYVAALLAAANNSPFAAKHAAEAALDEHPNSLAEMTARLPEYMKKLPGRGARAGAATMEFLVGMAEKKDSWN